MRRALKIGVSSILGLLGVLAGCLILVELLEPPPVQRPEEFRDFISRDYFLERASPTSAVRKFGGVFRFGLELHDAVPCGEPDKTWIVEGQSRMLSELASELQKPVFGEVLGFEFVPDFQERGYTQGLYIDKVFLAHEKIPSTCVWNDA